MRNTKTTQQSTMMTLKKSTQLFFLTSFVILIGTQASALAQLPNGWKAHDKNRPQPKVVSPGEQANQAPSDATVLLGGKELTHWTDQQGNPTKWKYADGILESVKKAGAIYTVQKFGDCQLHVEFATPTTPKGKGQGRGNSGVFFFDADYEIQVLDNYQNETYADGTVGGLYGQHPPLVNACRGPGQWQTYDIVFRKPRFNEDGTLKSPARMTAMLNGVLVQDASELYGPTVWLQAGQYKKKSGEGRISLQDHGNPVRYRNIWVRRLVENPPTPPKPRPQIELTQTQRQNYVGKFGPVKIEEIDGQLFFTRFRGRTFPLQVHSTTEMSFEKTAGELTFELDDQGKAISCTGSIDATGAFKGAREKSDNKSDP